MYCSMVFELNRVFSEKCIIRRHLFGQLVAKLRPFSLKSVLLILYIQASLIPQALMRPTVQWLQQLERSVPRLRSTSFIGLGRMGSEMAHNLFSKQYNQSQDSRFVVCDALQENARTFRDKFLAEFPGAKLEVVDAPEK